MQGKAIVAEINRVFGHNTILVKENGGQDLWAYFWPYYQVLNQNCCVAPAEQTAMGYGIDDQRLAGYVRPPRSPGAPLRCAFFGTLADHKGADLAIDYTRDDWRNLGSVFPTE